MTDKLLRYNMLPSRMYIVHLSFSAVDTEERNFRFIL